MEITYHEFAEILDTKNIATSSTGYTLPPGIYEISDNKFILTFLPPVDVKVNITIDDIRLRSSLSSKRKITFTKKPLFYTILGQIQSQTGPLGDIDEFIQLIPGIYKSDKPINFTGIDKIPSKMVVLLE